MRPSENLHREYCSLQMVRRVAAMLDIDPNDFSLNSEMPAGWHFFMMSGETRRGQLRQDGFTGLGVDIPDFGFPRLLFGGRTVRYHRGITIGTQITRKSNIKEIVEKNGHAGKMFIVYVQHDLMAEGSLLPAIEEVQTFILLGETKGKEPKAYPSVSSDELDTYAFQKKIVPDQTMLFQFSALGFNSHKIHLDRDYAREVEGLPDLVVNGGLTTLLVTEFLRNEVGVDIAALSTRHIVPLYCNQALTMVAEAVDDEWRVRVFDHKGVLSVEAQVSIK